MFDCFEARRCLACVHFSCVTSVASPLYCRLLNLLVGLRDEFDILQRLARSKGIERVLSEAREQLRRYMDQIAPPSTPALPQHVESVALLSTAAGGSKAPSSAATALFNETALASNVQTILHSHGEPGASLADLRLQLNCVTTHAADVLDTVIEQLQSDGLIYLDADRVYLL